MASIQKRGNSYLIKVSCGYNCKGKQMVQTMTWKPESGMTEKQIEEKITEFENLFGIEKKRFFHYKDNSIYTRSKHFLKRNFPRFFSLLKKTYHIIGK